jgi:hypothetical protein
VAAGGVVEAFDVLEDLSDELAAGWPGLAMDELFLSVAKKLSATALSNASPLEPIDMAMPASRAVWPKARETNCEPISE